MASRGQALSQSQMIANSLAKIKESIDFAKSYADLVCVDFLFKNEAYIEITSKLYRFCPDDNVEDGVFPVRCIIDVNGNIKLKILNFIAKEANWFEDRQDAQVIIRSLSFYGHRNRFCPGVHTLISIARLISITSLVLLGVPAAVFQGIVGHLSSEESNKSTLYNSHPYKHYRSTDCKYFYINTKAMLSVVFSRCCHCRKMYTRKMRLKSSLQNLSQEQMSERIMKQIHPSSHVKITTLPPELAQIRMQTKSKLKNKRGNLRLTQVKQEDQNEVNSD